MSKYCEQKYFNIRDIYLMSLSSLRACDFLHEQPGRFPNICRLPPVILNKSGRSRKAGREAAVKNPEVIPITIQHQGVQRECMVRTP